ncbi:MAG: hypothetical protein ACRC8L_06400, partial [Plesiomonas shigelloides]
AGKSKPCASRGIKIRSNTHKKAGNAGFFYQSGFLPLAERTRCSRSLFILSVHNGNLADCSKRLTSPLGAAIFHLPL